MKASYRRGICSRTKLDIVIHTSTIHNAIMKPQKRCTCSHSDSCEFGHSCGYSLEIETNAPIWPPIDFKGI